VRQELFARLGAEAVLRGGLRVETTLDAALQRAAHAAVRKGLLAFEARRGRRGAPPAEPSVEGALVALDVDSGDVLALVGGYDFARSQFDRATQARRQPGSAFKPFVYGAALAAGFLSSGPMYDYQVEYGNPATGLPWRPRNYKDVMRGEVPMYEAFARSLNNATIRLLEEVGVRRAITFARKTGIHSPLAGDLGLALGTSEVTLLEITSAYGTFASGGRPLRPRIVRSVRDRDGRELLADLTLEGNAVAAGGISPIDAYLVTNLLRAPVRHWFGTAHAAADLRRPLAGKTGSTNQNRDAWFIGFSPDLVAGVWVGRDDRSPLGRTETGSRAALPIWMDFMKSALASRPSREFAVPPGVQFAAADPVTGELQRSPRAIAGFEPLAIGRPVRQSRFVPPPLPPEIEEFGPEPFANETLPAVAAPPPP
jgi:penicillin-binding protein 1A